MLKTPGLTSTFGKVIEDYAKNSHEGMAHWAGSGPDGEICKRCRFMDYANEQSEKGICAKFRTMTSAKGKRFPVSALACKFFEGR